MNCELIFYLSGKTGLCEKAFASSLEGLNLSCRRSSFATSPETLGKSLIAAFERCNAVFVIGGIAPGDRSGIESVLSTALANKRPDDVKKLKNRLSRSDGYVVRRGGQLLVALPDEPAEIQDILNSERRGYLAQFIE